MKTTNYKRGYAFERKVMQMFKDAGWVCARTAGSHSPVDVIAINPNTMEVKLVQCKASYLTEKGIKKEVEKIKTTGLHTQYLTCVRVWLAYKEKGHTGAKLAVV